MVSNKLELKSEMQKAVNAVNGSVLLFCTIVLIFGLCTSIDQLCLVFGFT